MERQLMNKIWALAIVLVTAGCQDKIYETFQANSPVYMTYEDLRAAVKQENPRDIKNPGKIYFKDNYLFVNETMKGVHVLDVHDPSDPEKVAFISIPGNVDIAVKENVLYADSYVDLVAIDISDLDQIKEVARSEDIFPYILPPYDQEYRVAEVDKEKGVVLEWELKEIRQEFKRIDYPVYYYNTFSEKASLDMLNFTAATGGVGGGGGTTFGVGGSMARFGLYGDFLYVVDRSNLYTFNVAHVDNPVSLGTKNIGWDIETLFIYNQHLFFGTTTGMLVYNLEVEQNPSYVSRYTHITSCDPVVVQNDIAYVTLRDGGFCGSAVNRLDVLEMKDNYTKINLVASHSMANPHGLGIDGDILFICDGEAGLKVYNASDPLLIAQRRIASFPGIHAKDVIPLDNYLFMIGSGGFYLYDYSNLQDIRLLSTIPVAPAEE